MWRSLVARFVRDEEVAGSNPVTPTSVTERERNESFSPFCVERGRGRRRAIERQQSLRAAIFKPIKIIIIPNQRTKNNDFIHVNSVINS